MQPAPQFGDPSVSTYAMSFPSDSTHTSTPSSSPRTPPERPAVHAQITDDEVVPTTWPPPHAPHTQPRLSHPVQLPPHLQHHLRQLLLQSNHNQPPPPHGASPHVHETAHPQQQAQQLHAQPTPHQPPFPHEAATAPPQVTTNLQQNQHQQHPQQQHPQQQHPQQQHPQQQHAHQQHLHQQHPQQQNPQQQHPQVHQPPPQHDAVTRYDAQTGPHPVPPQAQAQQAQTQLLPCTAPVKRVWPPPPPPPKPAKGIKKGTRRTPKEKQVGTLRAQSKRTTRKQTPAAPSPPPEGQRLRIRRVQVDSPEGPRTGWLCPIAGCTLVWAELHHVATHIRASHGEHAFVCRHETCRKHFPTAQHLRYHLLASHHDRVFHADSFVPVPFRIIVNRPGQAKQRPAGSLGPIECIDLVEEDEQDVKEEDNMV